MDGMHRGENTARILWSNESRADMNLIAAYSQMLDFADRNVGRIGDRDDVVYVSDPSLRQDYASLAERIRLAASAESEAGRLLNEHARAALNAEFGRSVTAAPNP